MANSMLQQLFTEIKDTVISKIHGNKKEVALMRRGKRTGAHRGH